MAFVYSKATFAGIVTSLGSCVMHFYKRHKLERQLLVFHNFNQQEEM